MLRFNVKPVTVVVGKDEEKFFVHEWYLRASAEFFDKALSAPWKESETRIVTLPKAVPRAFEIYTKWLYCGKIYIIEPDNQNSGEEMQKTNDKEYSKLDKSYELANFLQDNDFKDALLDAHIEKMITENCYRADIAKTIYFYSSAASPHRRFVIDFAIFVWEESDLSAVATKNHSHELIVDLVAAMSSHLRHRVAEKSIAGFFKKLNICQYHEHSKTNSPCYKTKQKCLF